MASRKIFVGSLPPDITDGELRAEFAKYGQVEEIFIKPGCEPSRQWAFVTLATPEQAQCAKDACDRVLVFPGSAKPCDVMLAKNQGMFGQGGASNESPSRSFAQPDYGRAPAPIPAYVGGYGVAPTYGSITQAPPMAPSSGVKKIFVGSLPDGITDDELRAEFSKYGQVEDTFLKPNCESGRQWAFVSFETAEQAFQAAEYSNGVLQFPGSFRPCEVTLARNQGMFGQGPIAPAPGAAHSPQQAYEAAQGPRKIFVGSLPDDITEAQLRSEFSKYGAITDLFIKTGCETGRQWAFINFATPGQARHAKDSCDRVLAFPGSERACEVTMARNQGMFGQDVEPPAARLPAPELPAANGHAYGHRHGAAQYHPADAGRALPGDAPRKIFVGSLPDSITEFELRDEFSKYGEVVDLFLKLGCEPGRQWAFLTFATGEQAQYAKESTDRILSFSDSDRACEVMIAKNQGRNGQAPLAGVAPGAGYVGGAAVPAGGMGHYEPSQPPPPATPPPAHLTPWRMYRTAAGLPYYHNSATGVTQWECPPDLQVPGQSPSAGYLVPQMPQALSAGGAGAVPRYSPY